MSSESEQKRTTAEREEAAYTNPGFFPPADLSPNDIQNGNRSTDGIKHLHQNTLLDNPFSGHKDHINDSDMEEQHLLGNKKSGWKGLSSLEKSLSIALGLVSILSIALMIAVIIVGVKLNKDDYKPPDKITETTLYPPWVTTIRTTPRDIEVTTRERPTWPPSTSPSTDLTTTESETDAMECVSNQCLEINMTIDSSVNPCDDFYQFACGGWIRENPVSQANPNVDQSSRVRNSFDQDFQKLLESNGTGDEPDSFLMAQKFYEVCITSMNNSNLHAYDDLRQLADEMLMEYDNVTGANLISTLAKMRRELRANYLLSTWIDVHVENKSKIAIYLDHAKIGIENIRAYSDFMTDLWTNVYPEDGHILPEIVKSVFDFEKRLFEISNVLNDTNKTRFVNPDDYPSIEIISSLDTAKFQNEPWKLFTDQVFSSMYNCTNDFESCRQKSSHDVILMDPSFYKFINNLINSTNPATIGYYLKWRILLDFGKDTLDRIRVFYEKQITNKAMASSRKQACVAETKEFFGPALILTFLNKRIGNPVSLKTEVEEFAEDLRRTSLEIFKELSWGNSTASAETLEIISNKLENLEILALYPLSLLDENKTELSDYFRDLNLSNPLSHLQNILDLTKWQSQDELMVDNAANIKWKTFMRIQTNVDITYSDSLNALYIPFAATSLLMPLNLDQNDMEFGPNSVAHPVHIKFQQLITFQRALSYGSLGVLIGRRLVEAVENTAVSYVNGTPLSMWDVETLDEFENVAVCLRSQYESFNVTELSNNGSRNSSVESSEQIINGERTSKSNTMDVGGFKVALQAFNQQKKASLGNKNKLPGLKYSPDQLFFLGFAQNWCKVYTEEALLHEIQEGSQSPAKYRVKGVLENFEEFSKVWNCPKTIPISQTQSCFS